MNITNPQLLQERQQEIYQFYNSQVRPAIILTETIFKKFPVPVLNEIRNAQDHLARCFDDSIPNSNTTDFIEEQIAQVKGHWLRALLDCYKYIWYHLGAKVGKKYFWAKLFGFGKLSDINNGEFIETYHLLRKQAKQNYKSARETESINKEQSLDFYEKATSALIDLDELYDNNARSLTWAITKGLVLKALAALGWIISAIFTIVKYFPKICELWHASIGF